MPIVKPTDAWPNEWAIDFVGTSRIVTRATVVTADVSPIPAAALGAAASTPGRRRLFICNNAGLDFVGPTLFVGGSDVTKTTGYPLNAQEVLELAVTERVRVYGVAESSLNPVDVRTLEVV